MELKIINDVDLDVLKNYGFIYDDQLEHYIWEKEEPLNMFHDIEAITGIIVDEYRDRKINVYQYIKSYKKCGCIRDVYGIDVIFDLIQAGLVEKVKE